MISNVAAAGGTLARRFAEYAPPARDWKLDTASLLLFLTNMVLFLPAFLIIVYTFDQLYPTLAAVEDPLPAYEALSMNDDDTPKNNTEPVLTAQPGKPITASLRTINRRLRSFGGWTANFRGLGYAFVIGVLTIATTLFLGLIPFVNVRIAHLIALLAVSPLSTTWTHLVITPLSSRSFFSRIPSLRKTYLATWIPTAALWAAAHLSVLLTQLLSDLIGLTVIVIDPDHPKQTTRPTHSDVGKVLCVLAVATALSMLLIVPAHAALTRVQASLLPADEETIVPFDRSFGGRVEPEVVTGKGFATLGAALATVSRKSWLRIYLLRLKIFGATILVDMAVGAVLLVEVLIMLAIRGGK